MSSSAIRPIEIDDLPRIAQIFDKIFRGGKSGSLEPLIATLRDLFWHHPHHDPATRSLVHVRDGGVIDGFIGALPQPMIFRGQRLNGITSGGLVVEDPRVSPAAGAHLLRRLLAGPQDLTMTDTANRRSLDLQRALRCHTVPLQSLQWTKILRPASSVASLARDRFRLLGRLPLEAVARAADAIFRSSDGLYHRPDLAEGDWSDADVSHAAFAELFISLTETFQLRPGWTREDLIWVLGRTAEKTRLGPLFVRAVYGKKGEPIGAYLYYGKPGATAIVVQIINRKGSADAVLASLFAHALAQRCPMVRGSAQPLLMAGLFRARGVIYRHDAGTAVRARDPAIIEALRADDVLLGGIAGERWTRLS